MNDKTKRIIQQFAALLVANGVELTSPYSIENWCEDNLSHGRMREALWGFKEHDVVMLTKDRIAENYEIRAGECGTIVHVYDEENFEVEFNPELPDGKTDCLCITLGIGDIIKSA